MSIASLALAADNPAADTKVPLGRASTSRLELDLAKLMAGRCLIQGSSGAGKSQTLRRIIEEAFDYLTTIIVDPEGEFTNLAEHIGATTILARDYANDGLTALRCARVSTGSRFISTSPTSSLMCVSKKRQPSLPDSVSAARTLGQYGAGLYRRGPSAGAAYGSLGARCGDPPTWRGNTD
jgi:hypothetical protein